MLAQSADSGQSQYNDKGAMLTGGTYLASNGSVVWKGLGFSANGRKALFDSIPTFKIKHYYFEYYLQRATLNRNCASI